MIKASLYLLSLFFACTHIFVILICRGDTFTDWRTHLNEIILINYMPNNLLYIFFWSNRGNTTIHYVVLRSQATDFSCMIGSGIPKRGINQWCGELLLMWEKVVTGCLSLPFWIVGKTSEFIIWNLNGVSHEYMSLVLVLRHLTGLVL